MKSAQVRTSWLARQDCKAVLVLSALQALLLMVRKDWTSSPVKERIVSLERLFLTTLQGIE